MDCVSAVSLYGFDAIASGLAVALREQPLIRIMHRDLEKRLAAYYQYPGGPAAHSVSYRKALASRRLHGVRAMREVFILKYL
jgi:hypothetical protein